MSAGRLTVREYPTHQLSVTVVSLQSCRMAASLLCWRDESRNTELDMRTICCVALLLIALVAVPKARQASPHEGHGAHPGMSMPVDAEAVGPESKAKLLADKNESEFNHHLAGVFVALGAIFMLF